MSDFIPIVQHRQSGVHYEFLGGEKFRNLVTNQEGEVGEDKANRVFVFCPELSEMATENENIKKLLQLGFKQTK